MLCKIDLPFLKEHWEQVLSYVPKEILDRCDKTKMVDYDSFEKELFPFMFSPGAFPKEFSIWFHKLRIQPSDHCWGAFITACSLSIPSKCGCCLPHRYSSEYRRLKIRAEQDRCRISS